MRQRLAKIMTATTADVEAARRREEELRPRWLELRAAEGEAHQLAQAALADYMGAIRAGRLAEEGARRQ